MFHHGETENTENKKFLLYCHPDEGRICERDFSFVEMTELYICET